MKTPVTASACAALILALAAMPSLAAPSLPVMKPPVQIGPGNPGPAVDPSAARGQWFLNPETGDETCRPHEFHDNVSNNGGGFASHQAIAGHVTAFQWAGGIPNGAIIGFTILATITNDTPGTGAFTNGTNRHDETLDTTHRYAGALDNVLLTADFAIAEITNKPPEGDAYEQSSPVIYAENENLRAWYCWAPGGQGTPGGYTVPAWSFGSISPGGWQSKELVFAVEDPGLPPGDARRAAIIESLQNGTDVLLNRTLSLKISTWVDVLALDTGAPYPDQSPYRASDVSVFHDVWDFGDAPDPRFVGGGGGAYPTLLLNQGAGHLVNAAIRLGALIDGEGDGQPTAAADGDDVLGADDEDGVVFTSALPPGNTASVDVTASTNGYLSAWIDFNSDGDWADAGEQIFADTALAPGLNSLTFPVPSHATLTNTYARFRFGTAKSLSYLGLAPDGEVEDYLVDITEGTYEAPECAKWRQPCDREFGLDLQSWGYGQSMQEWQPVFKVADDWLCDGRPVTGVKWWGSYLGWMQQDPSTNIAPPLGLMAPWGFLLTWYTDVPAGSGGGFSRPGPVLAQAYYPLAQSPSQTNLVPGVVNQQAFCVSDLGFISPGAYEHEYQYHLRFPATNVWNEKEGQVYWLSIEAIYLNSPATNEWGWKTTGPTANWNDDAVLIQGAATNELIYPPQVWPWQDVTNHPYRGQSVNMAFELLTDVCPRRGKKWAQPPDMMYGENMPSFRAVGEEGFFPLRADDFQSDGRRISDIHWWGSYLGYMTNTPGPVDPPLAGYEKPLGFLLSWHADVPTNAVQPWSMPGELLTNVFVPLANCHEVYFGSVTQFWRTPAIWEHEFQYYVDLLNLYDPWYETNGVVYWLDIQAVFPQGWSPGGGGLGPATHYGWGWKTTPLPHRWNDASVITNVGPPYPWIPAEYPQGHLFQGTNCDLAFELTTDEPGTGSNWWNQPIRLVGVAVAGTATTNKVVGSVGDAGAGVQVLQYSTNLLASNWTDVVTKPLPLPAPYTNIWSDAPAAETAKFYRVKQR